MFGLKIFVRVQTFRQVPPVLPRNFCHPAFWYVFHPYESVLGFFPNESVLGFFNQMTWIFFTKWSETLISAWDRSSNIFHPYVKDKITQQGNQLPPKMHFTQKKHPKFLKRLIFIWEKLTFFFEQLFPFVARTWLESRSVTFFWAQNLGFWSGNQIFAIQPQFWSMTHL